MSGLRLRLIGMLVIVMLLAFASLLIGVNFGLRNDVDTLASRSADAGASALARQVSTRSDQIRDALLQATGNGQAGQAIASGDHTAVNQLASNAALAADLSFVVMTNTQGEIVGGSRPAK